LAILAPYVLLALGIGGFLALGTTDVGGPVRSLLAVAVLFGAGVIHVGLSQDARHLRTSDAAWTPQYRWYAIGGALLVLGAVLVLDVTIPGGILGGILLAAITGVFVTAPIYLTRRALTARQP